MTSAEWSVLEKAVDTLKAADKINADGSAPFPQSHDSYEWFVQIHGDRREGGACKHVSETIWAWHRAFLLHFENRLRSTNVPGSEKLTLPYWDWTEIPTGQHGFPQAYERSGSPLSFKRNYWSSSKAPLALAYEAAGQTIDPIMFVSGIVGIDDWGRFGGSGENSDTPTKGDMEARLHDVIHGYIGTVNNNTKLAVRDPVFWAHHANLDRLWGIWQSRHPLSPRCYECDNAAYDRSSDLGKLKIKDLIDNNHLPGAVRVVYLPKGTKPESMSVLRMTGAPRKNLPETLTYSFTIARDVGPSRILLRVEGLIVPKVDSYSISVYVYPESIRPSWDRAFAEKYGAGLLGNFAIGHEHHESGAGTQGVLEYLDITDAVLRARPDPGERGYRIAIRFVPSNKSKAYS